MKHSALWVACLGLACTTAWGGDVQRTGRYPLATVPRMAAPTIDGEVGKLEWYGAALMPRLIHQAEGSADQQRARVYIGYDAQAIYVAFQFDRPANALRPGDDDQCVILLDPAHQHGPPLLFSGNVHGPTAGQGWTCSARATDFGWEGEAAIAFASLHRSAPQPGEVWGIDVVNQQATPIASNSALSMALDRSSSRDLGHVVFADGAPVLRFREVGAFDQESGGGMTLELINFADQPAEVDVSLQLLRRKSGEAGGRVTYLKGIAQATAAVGADIVLPGTDLADMLKEHLARYEPDVGPNANLQRRVAVGGRQRVGLRVAQSEPGDYLVQYDLRHGEQTLARGVVPFTLSAPLRVTLQPFFLSPKVLAVKADLRRVEQWQQGARMTFAIARRAGETPLVTAERAFDGASELLVELPTAALQPGGYEFTAQVLDREGRRAAAWSEGFTKPPDPHWMTNPVAVSPRVPPPWTPIEVQGRRVSFLMGDYELGDTIWPRQIRTRTVFDKQRSGILRDAMSLGGRIDGQPIQWRGGRWRIASQSPHALRLEGTQVAGDLELRSVVTLEYDGMAKVELELRPGREGVTPVVEELWLSVPMSPQCSALYQTAPTPQGYKMKPFAGALKPDQTISTEFIFSVWLGDEERGFRWFAENWKGWKLGKEAAGEAIQIANSAQGATLRVNFVKGATLTLSQPRQIVFGYQFTPARSFDPRLLFHGMYHDRLDLDASAGANIIESWYYKYQGWPEIYSDDELQQKRRDLKFAHDHGVLLVPYSGWYLARDSHVAKTFGGEMLVDPVSNAGCGCDQNCWNTSITDAYTTLLADRVRDSGIDGYRMDAGFSAENCWSLVHRGYGSQCGWFDDEGKLQPSRAIFAAREASKRAYRVFHGDVAANGACLHHIHQGNRYDAVLSHQDFVVSAEGPEMHMTQLSQFPLDYFRAFVMGDAHGYRVIYMPKSPRMGVDARFGLVAIHNMLPRVAPILTMREVSNSRSAWSAAGLFRAYQWIDIADLEHTRFHGYWKPDSAVDTGNPAIVASYHVRQGRKMLLAMLNFSRQPLMTTVKVDAAKLGFKHLFARDANTFEQVPVERGAMSLAFTAEGYRLIELAAEPIDPWTPQRVSENLAPEFAGGSWDDAAVAAAWFDRSPPSAVRLENGQLVIEGDGSREISWQKLVPNAKKGDLFLVDAQARIDIPDDVFLNADPDAGFFQVSIGEFYANHRRTLAAQTPPGHFENIRLWYAMDEQPTTLRLFLRGKGKVTFNKFEVYKIAAAPPRPGMAP